MFPSNGNLYGMINGSRWAPGNIGRIVKRDSDLIVKGTHTIYKFDSCSKWYLFIHQLRVQNVFGLLLNQ
jgi:hypothetical protein